MDGFGPIRRELDEPVFHELWATSAGRNESLLIDLWESIWRGIEAARSPAGELPLQKTAAKTPLLPGEVTRAPL
jgi:hypothetical protein